MKLNTWSFLIPIVTERKPTAYELYLQALEAKYKYADYGEYLKNLDEAIEHYKKSAWKEEQ